MKALFYALAVVLIALIFIGKPKLIMESNQTLFSLTIDPVTKSHLLESAKWARFLAIVGMIFLFLGILIFIGVIAFIPNMPYNDFSGINSVGLKVGFSFYLILISAIGFFPLLFLLRYSNHLRSALQGNDQNLLNSSFQNLKILFRYLGIVTIIVLALYALGIVFWFIALGTMSR